MKKDQTKEEQTKEPKGKKVKAEKKVKSSAQLHTYEMTAVIPTVRYGNIQPRIMVTADNIKDATELILPHIEELYAKYCEDIPNFAKAPVVTVKEIPATQTQSEAPTSAENMAPVPKKEDVPHLSESYLKAKKIVESALSEDSLKLISDRVDKSKNLSEEEKEILTVMINTKIKELKK